MYVIWFLRLTKLRFLSFLPWKSIFPVYSKLNWSIRSRILEIGVLESAISSTFCPNSIFRLRLSTKGSPELMSSNMQMFWKSTRLVC